MFLYNFPKPEPEIVVLETGPRNRKYHISTQISEHNVSYNRTANIERVNKNENKTPPYFNMPEPTSALLEHIFKIPGVSNIAITTFCLDVHIGRCFQWGDEKSGIHFFICSMLFHFMNGCALKQCDRELEWPMVPEIFTNENTGPANGAGAQAAISGHEVANSQTSEQSKVVSERV